MCGYCCRDEASFHNVEMNNCILIRDVVIETSE